MNWNRILIVGMILSIVIALLPIPLSIWDNIAWHWILIISLPVGFGVFFILFIIWLVRTVREGKKAEGV